MINIKKMFERPEVYSFVLRLFCEEPGDRQDLTEWRKMIGEGTAEKLFDELDTAGMVVWYRSGRQLYPELTLEAGHQWRLWTRGISNNSWPKQTELDTFQLPSQRPHLLPRRRRRFHRRHSH